MLNIKNAIEKIKQVTPKSFGDYERFIAQLPQRTEFSDINELLDAVLGVEQDWTDDQLLQMMLDDHPDYQDET